MRRRTDLADLREGVDACCLMRFCGVVILLLCQSSVAAADPPPGDVPESARREMLTLQMFTPVDPFRAKPIRLRTATEADWAKIGAMPLPPLTPEVRNRPLAAVIAETVKRRLVWMPRLNERELKTVTNYTYGEFLGERQSATVAEGLDDLLHYASFLGFAPRRHNANFDEDVSYFYGAVLTDEFICILAIPSHVNVHVVGDGQPVTQEEVDRLPPLPQDRFLRNPPPEPSPATSQTVPNSLLPSPSPIATTMPTDVDAPTTPTSTSPP